MKFKSYLLLSSALLGLVNVSCSDKDDDSNEYSNTDSRIRSVHISGLNVPFVVNDFEHIIYNYDSLTYGTDISHRMIYFADYDVKSPGLTYLINENGDWKLYSNRTADSVYFDLRNLEIRTISLDQNNRSIYKLDIRVHKNDVNSFNWIKLSDLSFNGEVASFKNVEVNGVYCCFYTNKDGNSYVLSSTDAKKWTSKQLDKQSFDWNSLAVFGSKAVAFAGEKIATIDTDKDFAVTLTDNKAGLKSLLFSLGDKCWAVGKDGFYTCSGENMDSEKAFEVPSGFPTENITTLVTLSGSRTRVGYIYGTDNGVASVWVLDKSSNLIKISSSSNTGLPVLSKSVLVNIDDEISLLGGVNDKNEYMNTCYSSSNAGLTWSLNWHKELPSEIGRVANVGAFVASDGKLIFVAGETADGVATGVWNGVLKGDSKK